MTYAVIQQMVSDDVTQEMMTPHIEYMQKLHADGKIVVSGPFLDEAGGGMYILDVEDENELEDIVYGDPAVRSGILLNVIRPYRIVFNR